MKDKYCKKGDKVKFKIENNSILLVIPATNNGKFRFKKRKNRFDFGEIFSTREFHFDEQTYLEWQIGYDVPILSVNKGEKSTTVTNSFIGSNGKEKHPYELSEIFFKSIELGLITEEETKLLINQIKEYNDFIDKKDITVEHHSTVNINDMNFKETSIK